MENTLYPLQFMPVDTERPWGKEKWLLADLGFIDSEVLSGWLSGNTISELMQTYLEKMVGDDTFEYYGLQFPVSVKLIDFEGATPVFVHPDDTVAEERYDALGRTALWKVLSAEPGACIRLGFRQKVTAGELYAAAQEGRLETLLNEIPVKAGDTFVLEPGVPYAFSGKARILEVSEASSLIFDLTDPEDLVEAFDFISLEGKEIPGQADTPHFKVKESPGLEDGEGEFVLHVTPDGAQLTLFPAEADKKTFPKEGLFIRPGRLSPTEDQ